MSTYMNRYIEYKDSEGKWKLLKWYYNSADSKNTNILVRTPENDRDINGDNYKCWTLTYKFNSNYKKEIFIEEHSPILLNGYSSEYKALSFDQEGKLKANDNMILVGYIGDTENIKIIENRSDFYVKDFGHCSEVNHYSDNAVNIREYMRNTWEECPLAERGYPDDMSDELKSVLSEIVKVNDGRDYSYAHTYYTLAELIEFRDKKEDEFFNRMFDVIRGECRKDTSDKLDTIISILKGQEEPKKEESDDEEEYEDEYYGNIESIKEDMLYTIHALNDEIDWAYRLASEIADVHTEENIRYIVNLD